MHGPLHNGGHKTGPAEQIEMLIRKNAGIKDCFILNTSKNIYEIMAYVIIEKICAMVARYSPWGAAIGRHPATAGIGTLQNEC